jgi:hypothetical protein
MNERIYASSKGYMYCSSQSINANKAKYICTCSWLSSIVLVLPAHVRSCSKGLSLYKIQNILKIKLQKQQSIVNLWQEKDSVFYVNPRFCTRQNKKTWEKDISIKVTSDIIKYIETQNILPRERALNGSNISNVVILLSFQFFESLFISIWVLFKVPFTTNNVFDFHGK